MAQYRQTCSSAASDHVSLGIRFPHKQGGGIRTTNRRLGRSDKNNCKISLGSVIAILSLVLVLTVFAYYYVSRDKEVNRLDDQEDFLKNDVDFLANVTRIKNPKVLKFGHSSGAHGRDSRYWDRDDRRRDDGYNENVSEIANMDDDDKGSTDKNHVKKWSVSKQTTLDKSHKKQPVDHKNAGLYNEAGRDELKLYEAEYEASLKNVGQLVRVHKKDHKEVSDDAALGKQNEEVVSDDEYDDGIDSSDGRLTENDPHSDIADGQHDDNEDSSDTLEAIRKEPKTDKEAEDSDQGFNKTVEDETSQSDDFFKTDSRRGNFAKGLTSRRSTSEKRTDQRRKPKRHTGFGVITVFLSLPNNSSGRVAGLPLNFLWNCCK